MQYLKDLKWKHDVQSEIGECGRLRQDVCGWDVAMIITQPSMIDQYVRNLIWM